jgi:hypothetical protein
MTTIGLLGNEFDPSIKLLKVRIEDLGHRAVFVNLQNLPRVMRATLEFDRLIYDNNDLLAMGSFYLKQTDIRDPFFHIEYSKELWGMLRERYLAFALTEADCVLYTRSLLEMLSHRRPMVNPPQVYAHRTLLPFHLNVLARNGFSVPAFTTASSQDEVPGGFRDCLPLDLDVERTWDVFTFPKGKEKGLQIFGEEQTGNTYKLIVIGNRLLDHGLALSTETTRPNRIKREELPPEVAETALKAAAAVGAVFAEITLRQSADEGKVWLLRVDPSPHLHMLEEVHKLAVSEPLARYLITVAG